MFLPCHGRAAVRVVLLDMARQPTSRPFHDPAQELLIITGMGNNSKDGEAVIKVGRAAGCCCLVLAAVGMVSLAFAFCRCC